MNEHTVAHPPSALALSVRMEQLQRELAFSGIAAEPDHGNELLISIGPARVRIAERPHYCDRGRYLLRASSVNPTELTIDEQDLFPRYYFNNDCLVKELWSWFKARKLRKRIR